MKANRKSCAHDDRGAVGIGSMIVFIATILVAAVASAVLIDTSGFLQERAQRTGIETTRDVSSNLLIKSIVGKRDAGGATDKIKHLNITVALAPGAPPVDLKQLEIEISDGAVLKRLEHAAATAANKFTLLEVRDDDGSFDATSPVMNSGDLAEIQINLTDQGMDLDVRKDVSMNLIPESGGQVRADFSTPASFGTAKIVRLR